MRYIGNKEKILKEIEDVIINNNLDKNCESFFDAFSGTSTVGEFFKDKFKIIANDNLYMSYVISQAKLNTPDGKYSSLGFDPFEYFNSTNENTEGFIYKNYSPGGSQRKYFSKENAAKIDFIRWKIEEWKQKQLITDEEYYFLIASLLESVSKVANIAGVYGSYLKNWDPRAIKPMKYIPVQTTKEFSKTKNVVYNKKIEDLIENVEGDIIYLDPPYTKNQYSVQYHLLETIAKYDNPEIKGKTGSRDTSSQTSDFSKDGKVHIEFEKIIAKARFKYIIVSYSTDGIMSKEYIENVLKRYGKEDSFQFKKFTYRKYLNTKAKKDGEHFEYLFFIEKKDSSNVKYYSPLNYMGGKSEMVDFIKENMPNKKFKRFVDLFAGGFNVGVNFDVDEVIYNDCNFKVKQLIQMFRDIDTYDLYKFIITTIKKYGLKKEDKEAYLKARNDYNHPEPPIRDPRLLYVLILYGFQQQIRFNSSLEYNNPVGQSGFNDKILEKLISFSRRLKEKNILFMSEDFEKLEKYIDKDTFFYCDPPYLITLGSYNDGKRGFNGWNEDNEIRLLKFLDKIDKAKGKFMLSNVLEHNGKENILLKKWLKENKKYKKINYTGKARGRKEIIIINY